MGEIAFNKYRKHATKTESAEQAITQALQTKQFILQHNNIDQTAQIELMNIYLLFSKQKMEFKAQYMGHQWPCHFYLKGQ